MFGRRALWITLALTAATAAVFGIWPSLDFHVSDFFEDFAPSFAWRLAPWADHLREFGFLLPEATVAFLAGALIWKAIRPGMRLFCDARSIVAVLLTFVLGSGILVNVVLKNHWHRPRPLTSIEAVEQGDAAAFRPWWDPMGSCRRNCSFVSGEASAAMVTVIAASLLPASFGAGAVGFAIVVAVAVGFLRVAFGGHYVSDVLFGALFTQLVAIGMMALMHDERWPFGREGVIERWLERRGEGLRRALGFAA